MSTAGIWPEQSMTPLECPSGEPHVAGAAIVYDWLIAHGTTWPIMRGAIRNLTVLAMLRVTPRVRGSILWANLLLLFWLSLVPFVTGWMGENNFAPAPTALYGVILLIASIAYWILQRAIIAEQGETSLLAAAVGGDLKGKLSPVLYAIAIPSAFVHEW